MNENLLVQVQIYYEISMSIGNSLDLEEMLRESLPVYLKKLGCPAGMILIKETETDVSYFRPLVSVPTSINNNSSCKAIMNTLSGKLSEKEMKAYLKGLPIRGEMKSGKHYHVMNLNNFGLLILIRSKSPLDCSVVRSLKPLNDKLAGAAIACIHNQEIKRLKRKFEKTSVTDKLTGAMNRQFFDNKLEEEILREKRIRSPLSLIMLDIDNFKKVNDQYGHQAGDYVLVGISKCIRQLIRNTDFFVRWGGEEFVVMALTPLKGTCKLAEKLRKAIEDHDFSPIPRVTASFGVVEYESGMTPEEIVGLADKALYIAKKKGKNRVGYYSPEGEPI